MSRSLLCLTLGLLTSLLIATLASLSTSIDWHATRGVFAWPGPVPADWKPPDQFFSFRSAALRAVRYRGGAISGIGDGPTGSHFFSQSKDFERYDAGWPLPALRWTARVQTKDDNGYLGTGNISTHSRHGPESGLPAPRRIPGLIIQPDRRVPTTPVPSLAADTLIFGAAWFTLLFAPGALRRSLRRRRGLCPRCAYDLSGLAPGAPCPECGKGASA